MKEPLMTYRYDILSDNVDDSGRICTNKFNNKLLAGYSIISCDTLLNKGRST